MKIGTVIKFGMRNPKITLKSFSKQKTVLIFWENIFFPENQYIYPLAQPYNIDFPFLPKSDQTNSLLEWKLYT